MTAGEAKDVSITAECGDDEPVLPTFVEEQEARQRFQERSEKVEGLLEDSFKAGPTEVDEESRMPDILEKMDTYKRMKDSQISTALPDLCQQAEFHKERGNGKIKDGKFTDAFNAYKAGFDLFQDFSKVMLDSDTKRLLVALYSNASQALLKCEGVTGASTEGARQMADKALELEPTNTKALFRRGMAYAKSGDTNLALDDFQQILRLDPENIAAKKEIRALQAARKEQKRQQGEMQKKRAQDEQVETPGQKAVRLETAARQMIDARKKAEDSRDRALDKVKEAEAALAAAQHAAKTAEEEFSEARQQAEDAEAAAEEARRAATCES